MLPIPQEYIGSMCEVKSMENEFLSAGRIIKIDHDALEISAGSEGYMQLLKFKLPVKLFVYSSKLEDKILVGMVYLSTDNFLRVEEVGPLAAFERRGAFRVNSGVPAKLFTIMTEEEQEAFNKRVDEAPPDVAEALMEKTIIDVRVVDISLTGVRVQSPIPLSVGDKYGIEFRPLNDDLIFLLHIQRIIKKLDGSVSYGCVFYDVPERQMDALCRDLFQMQRLEKNRRRNTAAHIED